MRQLKIYKSITNRDSASLDKYLNDISKLPMVSVEEENQLTIRIKAGDNIALEKLVSANLRFVVSVAKQYQNQGLALVDLINEGNVGLIKAATRFDETRGFKFISYAVWWIRQAIVQSISEQSRVIRLPQNKIGALNKIKKAKNSLEQKLERMPTNSEIAELVDVSEKEINAAQRSSEWHISTDAYLPGEEQFTILDVLFNPEDEKPDDALIKDSLRIEIERALSFLTERERCIVVQYYGIAGAGSFSLEEIGEKYDLTRERVRQIKENAIRKLRSGNRSKLLLAYL